MTEEANSPSDAGVLDRALDLTLFAPLGFALECRRVVPELAQVGRRQIAFSRSLGRAALKTLTRSAAAAGSQRADTPARAASTEAADTSAVDGYDDLTARAVVALVRDASPDQRRWISDRERATKNRKTVLDALERAATGP